MCAFKVRFDCNCFLTQSVTLLPFPTLVFFKWIFAILQWHPTPVLLPGKSHGQRSLVGCSPWGHEESHTTERLHFHFSLSCIGEGNGNPLQCSCLENPRDGGACRLWGQTESDTTEATQQQQQQGQLNLQYNEISHQLGWLKCKRFTKSSANDEIE